MSTAPNWPRWRMGPDGTWYPPPPTRPPAGRDARRAAGVLALIPVAVIAGFVVGGILVGDPNAPDAPKRWAAVARIVPLWAMVEIPSVLGIVWGRRAMKAGDPAGRTWLLVNAVVFALFTLATLVGGTVDAFTG